MSELRLRFAQLADAGMMLAIYTDCAVGKEHAVPTRIEFTRRMEADMKAGLPWVVAEQEGALLGYACARRFDEKYGFYMDVEVAAYLTEDSFEYQLNGVLYTALLNLLYHQRYCGCYALVTNENESRISAYKAYGFKEFVRFSNTNFKDGRWLDTVCFHLNLQPCPEKLILPAPFGELDTRKVNEIFVRAADCSAQLN